MAKGFFICSTDTDAGKTTVTAGLASLMVEQGLKVVPMKPVDVGCIVRDNSLRSRDLDALLKVCNLPLSRDLLNPYRFSEVLPPLIAAQKNHQTISLDLIRQQYRTVASQADVVLMEGISGWLELLSEQQSCEDLVHALALPVILVVRIELGCINATLLTYERILASGVEAVAWVANIVDPKLDGTPRIIQLLQRTITIPLLGIVPPMPLATPSAVARYFNLDALALSDSER